MIAYQSKVYVIGAHGIKKENSVIIYDPATKVWSTGPPLPDFETGDHFHLVSILNDKLHVVGHYFKGKSHWVLEQGKWKAKAEAPFVCGWKGAAMETINDQLVLIAPSKSQELYFYSPKEDAWTTSGKLPEGFPEFLFSSAKLKNALYFIGGKPNPQKVLRYDIKTKEWSSSAEK